MSRPKTGRTERLDVRVTPDEAAVLSHLAEEAGYKTVSDYVRARVLGEGSAPKPRSVMSSEQAALVRALTAVGERLNFMLRLCAHDEALRVESEACAALVRETIISVGS